MNVLNLTMLIQSFIMHFLEICDKHAPIEEKTIGKSKKKKKNPWITKSIKRSIPEETQSLFKTIKSGYDKVHVDKYNKYRNTLTSVVRTAKKTTGNC